MYAYMGEAPTKRPYTLSEYDESHPIFEWVFQEIEDSISEERAAKLFFPKDMISDEMFIRYPMIVGKFVNTKSGVSGKAYSMLADPNTICVVEAVPMGATDFTFNMVPAEKLIWDTKEFIQTLPATSAHLVPGYLELIRFLEASTKRTGPAPEFLSENQLSRLGSSEILKHIREVYPRQNNLAVNKLVRIQAWTELYMWATRYRVGNETDHGYLDTVILTKIAASLVPSFSRFLAEKEEYLSGRA